MEAAFGRPTAAMLRCCKKPLDEDGPLYEAVTAPDSRAPVAPYFEARTQRPSVFHHGNRGMTRDRILEEAEVCSGPCARSWTARSGAGTALIAGSAPSRYIGSSGTGLGRTTHGSTKRRRSASRRVSGSWTSCAYWLFAVVVLLVFRCRVSCCALLVPWTVLRSPRGRGGALIVSSSIASASRCPAPDRDRIQPRRVPLRHCAADRRLRAGLRLSRR